MRLGECPDCGADVSERNRQRHSEWHRRINTVLRAAQEALAMLGRQVDTLTRAGEDDEGVFEAHLDGMDCGRTPCLTCGRP